LDEFMRRHSAEIEGVLDGFDRVLFRGVLRSINYERGLDKFLGAKRILLKDFKRFVSGCTAGIAAHAEAVARDSGRPYIYLESSGLRKDDYARGIAARDDVREGLICVLAVVEPCRTADLAYDKGTNRLRIIFRQRKCRFFYFYFLDREFGLMHLRLQSWVPFDLQVCVNGRLYLARALEREGIAFEQRHNALRGVADYARAQALLDGLVSRHWAGTLNAWAAGVNPLLERLGLTGDFGYYWTVAESEWATDVVFKDVRALQAAYPALTEHAMAHFHSRDVMRFLSGRDSDKLPNRVTSFRQHRPEGVRVKHVVNENSLKMYDKEGSILRIETTINNPRRFHVLRRRHGAMKWEIMCKGIRDIARRAQVSRAANGRYLDALSVVGETTPSHQILDPVSRAVTRNGYRFRALRPISPEDSRFLQAILHGDGFLHGFTNRTLQTVLFAAPAGTPDEARRRAASISRKLRLLRAHGLIHKVPRRNLYRISLAGHEVAATALIFRRTDFALLKRGA
jgi:hypothetical protein